MYFRITTMVLALLLGARAVFAEGTAQLIPAGGGSSCLSYIQGNDGSGKEGPGFDRPWYDRLYVHIHDPSTETIYYGFSNPAASSFDLYYRIIAPDGSILRAGKVAGSASDSGYVADDGVEAYVGPNAIAGSNGYDQLVCTPTMAGDYAIVFNVGDDSIISTSPRYYVHPLDVTVADASGSGTPTAITGRLFSYKWHLNTNSGSNKACMQFYTWTPDSLVISMDMNEIQPYGYTVSFNSHGATQTGDIEADRKSSTTVSEAVPEYPVFLQEPDTTAYPTGTPGVITYLNVDGCHLDSSFCIRVNATKVGEINVFIDLNGNGVYEEGTVDRYFPYQNSTTGDQCIPWDGLDGLGNPISSGDSGEIVVQFLAGVVHYPVYDPENHTNGFNTTMVRPSGYTPLMYFDNRNTGIGTYDLSGCSSGCNTWSGNAGDKVMVNTWLNTITSSDTASFKVNNQCAPIAIADSGCGAVGYETQLPILQNDQDSDNSLDPYTLQLSQISISGASVSFDTSRQILRYIPQAGEDTLRLVYEICDNTGASDGGPLCDQATVMVSVYDGCLNAMVLPAKDWRLQLSPRHGHVAIRWRYLGDHPPDQVWLERRSLGTRFERLTHLNPSGKREYIDLGVRYLEAPSLFYRLGGLFPDGHIEYSPTKRIKLPGEAGLWVKVDLAAEKLDVEYLCPLPAELRIVDLSNRELVSQRLSPEPYKQKKNLDLSNWSPGVYLVMIIQDDGQFFQQRFTISR